MSVPDRSVLRERALELRAEGLGYTRIARETGIPYGTVRRWVNPLHAERTRRASLACKENQRGVCERCGAPTAWIGGAGKPKNASICRDCYDGDREPDHGTLSRYTSNKWACRCVECRAANAAYQRGLRLRMKQAA